jgi:hypothetical protein
MEDKKMRLSMVLCYSVLLAGTLSAQTFRGTILGTVTDASGAVLPSAKVTVRNSSTGLERTVQTGAEGSYSIPELPIGTYTVSVSQTGFQTSVTSDVVVNVATERRVDAALKPGEVSQRIEVSGEALPQVETTSAELGGTLTTHTIENLPVNGRDYTKLIYLNPGVAGSPDQITDSPGALGVFSMNGSRGRSNNFLLDGTDMNDGYRNDPAINQGGVFGVPATILSIDAVAELRVLSNYEAEYGRNSGAVINIVTTSGTNEYHGSALEYFRSNTLNARNYFNSGPKSLFRNNQFGGSFGGPIVKDKTFFFVNYEGQREKGGQTNLSCVPEPAQIALAKANIEARGETVSQTILSLLARNPWPAPNRRAPSGESGCNNPNVANNTNFSNRVDSLITKIDHSFNPSNLITGRYYFGDSDQSFPVAIGSAGDLPGFNTVSPTRVQLVSISYVKVVNANQVNEARLGWNRFVEGFVPEDQKFDPASIGLNTGVVGSFDFGLPLINVGTFTAIGASKSVPRQRVDSNWHFIDNYSWKMARHDVKFGYEFRRTTITNTQDNNFRGKLTFNSITDPANTAITLPPLEAFLEGIPSGGGQAQGFTTRHAFENNHGFYVQDKFRMTPRVTFNIGLRWDYFGVVGEKNNIFYRFNPANGGSTLRVGSPGGPSGLYESDYKNFAPRVSVAWDVFGKGTSVIRAGYGIFYDAFSQDIFLGHIPYNCTFCPGPTYTGQGPGAIGFASLSGVAISPSTSVYSSPSPLRDFFATDPNIRMPYTQNFNLNFQRQITNKAVLQIGYVGAKGTRLFRFRDINQPSQATITATDLACGCIAGFSNSTTGQPTSVPRPFSNFPTNFINQEESTTSSIYHALQTSLRLNGWHGLQSMVNYAWSHSIDNASDLEDFQPNAAQPNNSLFPNLERGNSNFDIRQRLTWNFTYEFPKWKGSWSKLTDGWGFGGVLNLQSGQPFQLNYNFEGDYSGSGEGFDRPDVVGPTRYSSNPLQFLDLTSFAAPCTVSPPKASASGEQICAPGTRHFGNEPRSYLVGPHFREMNFSILKNTALSERVNLQFRAEFFNLFNHPNFANPFLPAFIADPGTPGPTGRQVGFLALSATGDVGIGNPFLGGGGPRSIQFAAKITF